MRASGQDKAHNDKEASETRSASALHLDFRASNRTAASQ